MKITGIIYLTFFILLFNSVKAQDDLLNELDSISTKNKTEVKAAFKALQICNMQSTKMADKGEFYFVVSHRFGDLTDGTKNFFGLDNALTKIGGIYGVTDWLSVGASRHTFQKTYELALKYRIANQQQYGFPVTIVGYNTLDIRTDVNTDLYPELKFNDRLAYFSQILVSRKFTNKLSAEITPIYIHKNLFDELAEQKNLALIGVGARYKISKRMSVNFDYAARVGIPEGFISPYYNPASIGLDIETGGHVFQLIFSNSQKMNDVSYYSSATGINKGKQIFFGFNMYRVF